MTADPPYASHLLSWVNNYLEVSPHVLFGNAILGTLSTDGVRVYAVDDLAVPPYRRSPRGRWRQEFSWPDFGPGLTEAADSSRLLALDAISGKLLWEIGGRGGTSRAGRVSDSYFLGPPLPLDGRLYALTERDNELALVCLAADGALVWRSRTLAYAPTRLLLDPGPHTPGRPPGLRGGHSRLPDQRRNGRWRGPAHPGPGVGLLVPNKAFDAIPAVLRGRRVRASPTRITAEWQAPVTVVQGSKALFTAPDCPSIHCLSLRVGSPLWEAARANDDLYVAGVFAGKVLVVGKQACRLDLADGKQLWQVGDRAALRPGRGQRRHLLSAFEGGAAQGKEPAIYAIDLRKGVIRRRTPRPGRKFRATYSCGTAKSSRGQTVTAVTAYPKRKEGE